MAKPKDEGKGLKASEDVRIRLVRATQIDLLVLLPGTVLVLPSSKAAELIKAKHAIVWPKERK